VREETAILKQGEVKLMTNGDAGPPAKAALASHNKGVWGALSGLTVNRPAKLFVVTTVASPQPVTWWPEWTGNSAKGAGKLRMPNTFEHRPEPSSWKIFLPDKVTTW
jgi:hypothetical protein